MRAMILAAGRGERMRPLTDTLPKPMLTVQGIPLIEHHVKNLAKAGITDIIINHAWLGEKIEDHLGCGEQFGVVIQYSREAAQALETAGGIIKALPLLMKEGDATAPFLVVNGDVFTSFDFAQITTLNDEALAKIWLVENPEHNVNGDFCLVDANIVNRTATENKQTYTFTGIGLYRPLFFAALSNEKVLALGPLLRELADKEKLEGEVIECNWTDVGTPERLAQLNQS